jgi:hypothetical protein
MDFNRLYYDHQVSLIQAARSEPGGKAGFEIAAARLAAYIGHSRRTLGAPAAGAWERLASQAQPTGIKRGHGAARRELGNQASSDSAARRA